MRLKDPSHYGVIGIAVFALLVYTAVVGYTTYVLLGGILSNVGVYLPIWPTG